ncbi:hypothetical protein T10_5292, partial [Trichinella papuae]
LLYPWSDCQIIDKKVTKNNRPIREKQLLLYPWSIFHFSGVRLTVAVRSKRPSERKETAFSLTPSVDGSTAYKEWSKEKVKTRTT